MSERDPRAGRDCGGNAAPYVLGSLSDAEHAEFVAHLSGCAVCRDEVAALRAVAAALPMAAPQFTAPPKLKRRVMGEVRADARAARSPSPRRSRSRPARGPLLAGLAAAAVVVALVAVVIGATGGGGTRVVRAAVSAPGASASVRLSGGHAELTASGMPATPPGRVYEVWVKRAGAPEPTDALFTVTTQGRASVGVPGGTAGVKAVLVTSEPRGGSRAPTTAPIIVARIGA
jgi:anti-sigma-K factor RskA